MCLHGMDAKYGKPGDLIAEIKKQGFKTVTIIDPGTKVDPDYFMCKEGEENGYFATDTQGTTYVNEVWPGDANYPEFWTPQSTRLVGKTP